MPYSSLPPRCPDSFRPGGRSIAVCGPGTTESRTSRTVSCLCTLQFHSVSRNLPQYTVLPVRTYGVRARLGTKEYPYPDGLSVQASGCLVHVQYLRMPDDLGDLRCGPPRSRPGLRSIFQFLRISTSLVVLSAIILVGRWSSKLDTMRTYMFGDTRPSRVPFWHYKSRTRRCLRYISSR